MYEKDFHIGLEMRAIIKKAQEISQTYHCIVEDGLCIVVIIAEFPIPPNLIKRLQEISHWKEQWILLGQWRIATNGQRTNDEHFLEAEAVWDPTRDAT
jgi:hypothetical protein